MGLTHPAGCGLPRRRRGRHGLGRGERPVRPGPAERFAGGAAASFTSAFTSVFTSVLTVSVAAGGMAGSIICALFLKRFVSAAKSWLHFDIYAWTPSAKPGRPEGGECQAARALYALLTERYGR